jgi:hypothetical protein
MMADVQSVALMFFIFGPVVSVASALAPRIRGIQGPAKSWFTRAAIVFALLGAAGALTYVIIYLLTGTTAGS